MVEAVAIVELDNNGDTLLVWYVYPHCDVFKEQSYVFLIASARFDVLRLVHLSYFFLCNGFRALFVYARTHCFCRSFPGVSKELEQVLLEVNLFFWPVLFLNKIYAVLIAHCCVFCQRSGLKNAETPKFSFGKHKALWHYSTVFDVEDEQKGLDKVQRIAIVSIDSVCLGVIFLCKFDFWDLSFTSLCRHSTLRNSAPWMKFFLQRLVVYV